jgi:hypothetical protein
MLLPIELLLCSVGSFVFTNAHLFFVMPAFGCFCVRAVAEYWERADFPFELVPKLKTLGIGGGSIKGNGCAVRPSSSCNRQKMVQQWC